MNIRPIHVTDAAAYLALLQRLEAESPYAGLEAGERRTSVREQMDDLYSLPASSNSMIIIAEDGDTLVGWLGASGSTGSRTRHRTQLQVGVLQSYQRQGVGAGMYQQLETWARRQDLRRLELQVVSDNKPGIQFFRKMGFQIEGTTRESYRIGDEYYDEYLMSKLIAEPVPPPRNPFPKW
ncbi:MAG: GNAT family N-acetyltransferase [Bacteroidia bacterium]|nr:GNAT family N-acetyltransferase [Bacteroidia bacterium]